MKPWVFYIELDGTAHPTSSPLPDVIPLSRRNWFSFRPVLTVCRAQVDLAAQVSKIGIAVGEGREE